MQVVKNIEQQLLTERKRRRKSGEVPYPLDYSFSMLNFDNWDHMFLVRCCRSLTMHQFTEPPSVVLDLGCGGGYWAIEAAKHWRGSMIFGFDMKKIQPSRSVLGSLNVRWVHGNLLEVLPFESNYFDFVRIVGIGLGVPEDEWQYVLEEVARVMKPGAALEIIEEDLIFPCGSNSTPMPQSAYSPTSSMTILSDGWLHQRFPDKSSQDTLPMSPTSSSVHSSWPTSIGSQATFNSCQTTPSSPPDAISHLQDHSKLKTAWDAMLSSRFLAPQVISVLPFYLSLTFVDVQTHPPLKIPLPHNSRSGVRGSPYSFSTTWQESFDPDVLFNLKAHSGQISIKTQSDFSSLRSGKTSQRRVPSCSSMHLAKTVQTVVGCKESIWVEYEKLYDNSLPPVIRARRPRETVKPSLREEFERAWLNWENDMMDRISMRENMASECSWHDPFDERPDWRVWRNNLEIDPNNAMCRPPSPDTPNLCRSLRCFVGWKPS